MELFSFIFGAVFGSFLNVIIKRVPKNQSIITPRSYCNNCQTTIPWYYNIPIISYIVLKGRCKNCKESYGIQYFLVELITALITLFLFIKLGLSYEFVSTLLFFYLLIVLSFIDFEYKAVPDYLLLLLFVVSLFITNYDLIIALKNALLFAGGFFLLNFILTFYIQNIKSKILKDETLKTQEALGEGDIPVIASFAIVLGINSTLLAIFLSAIFAIIPSIYSSIVKKDIQTAFIPYLSLGFVVAYFFDLNDILKVFS